MDSLAPHGAAMSTRPSTPSWPSLITLAPLLLLLGPAAAPGQVLPPVDPGHVGLSTDRLARIDSVFAGYVEQSALPGAVVLVARDGAVAYHEAFGMRDVEAEDPMPADAIFRIASQTKALISVGIMILQEEGRLLIGSPLVIRWCRGAQGQA